MRKTGFTVIGILSLLLFGCEQKSTIKIEISPTTNKELDLTTITFKEVTIDSIVSVVLSDKYIKPVFDESGLKLFLTTTGYVGLHFLDLTTSEVDTISSKRSAGYNFCFDSQNVYFIENEYDQKLKSREYRIVRYNLDGKTFEQIASNKRKVHSLDLDGDILSYFVQDNLKLINVRTGLEISPDQMDIERYLISKNSVIKFSKKGKDEIPISAKNNLSGIQKIDDENLLIEVAAEGLFIFSMKDSSKISVGDYNSVSYNKITGMFAFNQSENDGHKVTKSTLGIKHLTKSIEKSVTLDNYLVENQSWSSDGKMLAFNTFDGQIKIAYISYK